MVVVTTETAHMRTLVLQLSLARMQMLQHMPTTSVSRNANRPVVDKVQVAAVDLEHLAAVAVQGRAPEDPRVRIADPQVVDGMQLLQHLHDPSPHVRVQGPASSIRQGLGRYPREIVHRENKSIENGASSS